jgi:hypothetical protein
MSKSWVSDWYPEHFFSASRCSSAYLSVVLDGPSSSLNETCRVGRNWVCCANNPTPRTHTPQSRTKTTISTTVRNISRGTHRLVIDPELSPFLICPTPIRPRLDPMSLTPDTRIHRRQRSRPSQGVIDSGMNFICVTNNRLIDINLQCLRMSISDQKLHHLMHVLTPCSRILHRSTVLHRRRLAPARGFLVTQSFTMPSSKGKPTDPELREQLKEGEYLNLYHFGL